MIISNRNPKKAKLWYMAKDSFIAYIKTDDIYKDIAEDVETIFDTSNYELYKPLLKPLPLANYLNINF